MERIGVRELRQHASRYLARVKAGETVEVTERGELIAVIAPPHPAASERDRLVASGQLVPRTAGVHFPVRLRADVSSEDVLAELRDER